MLLLLIVLFAWSLRPCGVRTLHWGRRWKVSIPTNIHFFELLLADAAGLTLIIVVESFSINENLYDCVAYTTPDKVLKLDAVG